MIFLVTVALVEGCSGSNSAKPLNPAAAKTVAAKDCAAADEPVTSSGAKLGQGGSITGAQLVTLFRRSAQALEMIDAKLEALQTSPSLQAMMRRLAADNAVAARADEAAVKQLSQRPRQTPVPSNIIQRAYRPVQAAQSNTALYAAQVDLPDVCVGQT